MYKNCDNKSIMIDIDVEFERQLYEKLQVLDPLAKAKVFEMLLRLNKEPIKIGDFSQKYRMNSDTAKQASEILLQFELISMEEIGRKKILSLTDTGKELVKYLDHIQSLVTKREEDDD